MNEGSRTGPTYLIKVVLGAKKSKEKFQEICHFEEALFVQEGIKAGRGCNIFGTIDLN